MVEMERTDTGINLRVNAIDPATLGLLQASVNELNSNLSQQDSIFQEVDIDVTTGDGSEQSADDDLPRRNTKKHTLDNVEQFINNDHKDVDFVA